MCERCTHTRTHAHTHARGSGVHSLALPGPVSAASITAPSALSPSPSRDQQSAPPGYLSKSPICESSHPPVLPVLQIPNPQSPIPNPQSQRRKELHAKPGEERKEAVAEAGVEPAQSSLQHRRIAPPHRITRPHKHLARPPSARPPRITRPASTAHWQWHPPPPPPPSPSFALSHITDLLESLESLHTQTSPSSPPLPALALAHKARSRITSWFDFHHPTLRNHPRTLAALYSLLLPHLRPDRSYALREAALARIVARAQLLGATRAAALHSWRASRVDGDFAAVVARVLAQAECPPDSRVTVEYVDAVLDRVAAKSRFSSDGLRAAVAGEEGEEAGEAGEDAGGSTRADILEALYRRLTSVQAKWVTRVVLKCLAPVEMPESHTLSAYHFLLPHLFRFQQDLSKACALVCAPEYRVHARFPPPSEREVILRSLAAQVLRPEIGVKVGRPEFVKARSCKHAAALAAGRAFSLERKYDGEYIQIHIDTSRPSPSDWLTLFSKSGRNSTDDRIRVHDTLITTLALAPAPPTTHILEGELLAYSTATNTILPFHHVRALVHRAGTYIGVPRPTSTTSTSTSSSQLMVVLFDALLADGESLLHRPYRARLQHLRRLLPRPVAGRVVLAERTEVDFGAGGAGAAVDALRRWFVAGVARGWEGVVMKPLEAAYVDFGGGGGDVGARTVGHAGGRGAWVKVKKDYMVGCGDTGDFAVVGARAEGARGWRLGVGAKALTVFHVGCLTNREEVRGGRAKPRFKLVFEVCYSVPRHDLEEINRLAPFRTVPYDPTTAPFTLDPLPGVTTPTHLFPTPLVFELTGAGFEKHAHTPFYVLRHPRVCKVYFERDYLDALTLAELQDAARAAEALPRGVREEEAAERAWVRRVLAAEGKRAWGEEEEEEGGEGVEGAGAVKRVKREVSSGAAEVIPGVEEASPPPVLVEGNDQKSGIAETAAEGANVAAAAEKQRTTPTPARTPGPAEQQSPNSAVAAISPTKAAMPPPPPVLREISTKMNPQGRKRSLGGENAPPKRYLAGSPVTEFDLSKNTAGDGAMATVLDNDENQQPRIIPALKSTPSQLIEQPQLIQVKRVHHHRAHTKPPPIPSCATTTTLPETTEALELKNGHSRSSPLLGATVLLPHYLFKFPELKAKIDAHRPAVVHALPAAAGDIPPLMPASKRCVVLVEPNKTSLTKKTLKGLAAAAGAVGGGYGFEVYDWRVAGKVQPEGAWEVDWSLYHVWSVV
ncbi:hypothetical protein DFP73DRAFT_635595 [Morchella snyderi]|nr:hypothetical protein DFP73DRAFT_635595 [Morchella snyderi]